MFAGGCSSSLTCAPGEADLPWLVKINLRARKLENGEDYLNVTPKRQVTALGLESGEIVTEGPVIVQLIADLAAAKNWRRLGQFRALHVLGEFP